MLPTLNLDMSNICQARTDIFSGGKTSFVGRTRCYHLDKLRNAAISSNENLDGFLTKHLAAGMAAKPVKSELLFWFAPGNDLIWLTPCDKALRVGCWWMNEIPGYWESGTEGVRDNARPFAYWDGKNLYRIYALPDNFREDALYLNDLGTLFGLTVEECNEETHRIFRHERVERWDYSVVPTESEEIVEFEGKKLVVLHAFWVDERGRRARGAEEEEWVSSFEEYVLSHDVQLDETSTSKDDEEDDLGVQPLKQDGILMARDYRLNEMPRDAAGNVLSVGDSDSGYDAYIAWLADYLYHADIQPSIHQAELCNYLYQLDKAGAMEWLGSSAPYYAAAVIEAEICACDLLGDSIEAGFTDEDVERVNAELTERLKDDSTEITTQSKVRIGQVMGACEYVRSLNKSEVKHIMIEYREERLCCRERFGEAGHADDLPDHGWRIPLALLLRDVTERARRVELLDIFFSNYAIHF